MTKQENKKYYPLVELGVWELYLENINIKDLTNICYETQKKYKSITKSNKGGYQSPSNIHNDPLLHPLVNRLNNEIQIHHNNPNIYIEGLWLNISSTTNFNVLHTHAREFHQIGQISGVLYIQTPLHSGDFMVNSPLDFNNSLNISPTAGKLLLFNKGLPHSVNSNISKDDRISIAFNCNI